jgi:hypothetical protein
MKTEDASKEQIRHYQQMTGEQRLAWRWNCMNFPAT